MTNAAMIGNIIWATLVLSVLWYLLFDLYRNCCVDRFREEMFKIRNELFDHALSGVFTFDEPAYTLFRTTLNGFIRFGDRINITTAVLMSRSLRNVAPDFPERYAELQATLTLEQDSILRDIRSRMNRVVMLHVLFGSAAFVVLAVFPYILLRVAKHAAGSMFDKIRRSTGIWANRVDSIAFRYGKAKEPYLST
jgi:hypothetical protein